MQYIAVQSRVEQQRRAVQSGVDESRIKESRVEQRTTAAGDKLRANATL